jgi:FdhD protein
MTELTVKKRIMRYNNGEALEEDDFICVEASIDIYIDDIFYISVMCLPDKLEVFITGFLFFENIIQEYSDIKNIKILENRIDVSLYKPVKNLKDRKKILTTGCGQSIVSIDLANPVKCKKIDLIFRINKANIIDMMRKFIKYSELFTETGAVHSCAISDGNEILFFADDVGRHNAFDKVVGFCLMNHIDMNQKILLTTGRISSEMMAKTIKSKIPIIISRSAPTSYAVKLAEKFLITLVGFARSDKFNVYSYHERINFDD